MRDALFSQKRKEKEPLSLFPTPFLSPAWLLPSALSHCPQWGERKPFDVCGCFSASCNKEDSERSNKTDWCSVLWGWRAAHALISGAGALLVAVSVTRDSGLRPQAPNLDTPCLPLLPSLPPLPVALPPLGLPYQAPQAPSATGPLHRLFSRLDCCPPSISMVSLSHHSRLCLTVPLREAFLTPPSHTAAPSAAPTAGRLMVS